MYIESDIRKTMYFKTYIHRTYILSFACVISSTYLWDTPYRGYTVQYLSVQEAVIAFMADVRISDCCRPLFSRLQVLTVRIQFIYDIVRNIQNRIKVLTSRRGIIGLGMRRWGSWNILRRRLFKTQASFSLAAWRLYNELPKYVTVLYLKRFGLDLAGGLE